MDDEPPRDEHQAQRDEPDHPQESPAALRPQDPDAPVPDAGIDRLPSCRCALLRRLPTSGRLRAHSTPWSPSAIVADDVELGHELDAGGVGHAGAAPRRRGRRRHGRWRRSSAWKKLACLSDTTAPPTRRPLSPAASMSRPAESPGGLRNTEPAFGAARLVLASPAHDLGRPARSQAAGSSRVATNSAATTTSRRPARSSAGSRGRDRRRRAARVAGWLPPSRRSTTQAAAQDLDGLAAVPAGVHPHRPADRARDARRRTRARQAAGRRPARRAPGSGTAPPARSTTVTPCASGEGSSTASKSPSSTTTRPGKPASATSRFDPRPTTRTARPVTVARLPRPRRGAVGVTRPRTEHRDRAADPVRGELRRTARARGGPVRATGVAASPASGARSTDAVTTPPARTTRRAAS